MSRVTPVQSNFNAGELSRRLHGRIDLNLYGIGMAELTGWIPLVEGGLDACPGFLRVDAAPGPCRLIPFQYSVTQSYIMAMAAGVAHFFTNDARIEADGAPVALTTLPYTLSEINALTWEQSYDVLYLFHPNHQTRALARVDADTFEASMLELENGPFEARNKDQALIVKASGVVGSVTLAASRGGQPYALFEPGDVGGLFELEADDFGNIPSWEPGVTVAINDLLTWNERVYAVVGGGEAMRTGTVAPVHNKGVEWDGIGKGQDINDEVAGGVQLEYLHDRFGVLRLTEYVDSATMQATVLRRLPFTTAGN
ncbi:hypothetical protein [Stakelama pacifica]|uniref:Uncharacterized protein n=1 Tax=Stakelama pacifica TaxID=517720 RepID=A0A4R6FQB1_9SPHN|nr:hypothetical protein [Stakelama pacifica]TDN82974.1 hypothetical protein EV664_105172 [Stakelama pacifica]GGO95033.1 hypothetical protein GCM10011329_18260 [Stakelama pacifica]